LGKERKVFKTNILAQIEELDRVADTVGLDDDGWATRYHLEDQILAINRMEEEYWRQHSRVQWTVQGTRALDTSTRLRMGGTASVLFLG
jgi:hypothetical protein